MTTTNLSRRGFLITSTTALVMAPAIVRAASLMPISVLDQFIALPDELMLRVGDSALPLYMGKDTLRVLLADAGLSVSRLRPQSSAALGWPPHSFFLPDATIRADKADGSFALYRTDARSPSGRALDFDSSRLGSNPRRATRPT